MGRPMGRGSSILVAAVVLLAGCGSGAEKRPPLSEAEYQAAVTEIVRDSADANSLYYDLVATRRPGGRCSELMRSFDGELSGLIERVEALVPPPDVAAIHEDFVTAARRSLGGVEEAKAAVEAGDLSCGRELNEVIYGMSSSAEAEEAISRLEERGYLVFGE